MAKVTATPLPPDSLLAQHMEPGDYGDCFTAEVPGQVALPDYITRFYSSPAFWPERKLLALIGKGANHTDIAAHAKGERESFAAWNVVARREDEILLRDFRGRTSSWLKVEPGESKTVLYFGSGVRNPETPLMYAVRPLHIWYSRVLLGGV
ncbi:hypothetical protein [Parerythrobacter jejuensis]|uniref:Uncharacterized protein n=1 Tax=Parerythrobacter jejuensis TaxID=795812 RepID=A0A845AXH7_9SPHN|nr:hypothetical protein [Parerythrobacter jejuensis]MXP31227.1 hypothetical protein [Parerythrobacter jejuensis]MXP33987.1 hypothetical protein [Parerythrobacter jejuensis]